jgi:hypothetical protein
MALTILEELINEGSQYWLNVHTKDLFYLCKARPMELVSKIHFRQFLTAGVIKLVETTDEVEVYKATKWADEHISEVNAHKGFINWLSKEKL